MIDKIYYFLLIIKTNSINLHFFLNIITLWKFYYNLLIFYIINNIYLIIKIYIAVNIIFIKNKIATHFEIKYPLNYSFHFN